MSKSCIPFSVTDISALARGLRQQLADCDHTPGHVELLNMLARCIGHRNFQSLRAQAVAHDLLYASKAAPEPVDHVLVRDLTRYFDSAGRLASWPAKATLKTLCLWVLWSKLPANRPMAESELNAQIQAAHVFGDYPLLRRELCDQGLMRRTPDGREYRRVERRPPPEAIVLIRLLAGREVL